VFQITEIPHVSYEIVNVNLLRFYFQRACIVYFLLRPRMNENEYISNNVRKRVTNLAEGNLLRYGAI